MIPMTRNWYHFLTSLDYRTLSTIVYIWYHSLQLDSNSRLILRITISHCFKSHLSFLISLIASAIARSLTELIFMVNSFIQSVPRWSSADRSKGMSLRRLSHPHNYQWHPISTFSCALSISHALSSLSASRFALDSLKSLWSLALIILILQPPGGRAPRGRFIGHPMGERSASGESPDRDPWLENGETMWEIERVQGNDYEKWRDST